MPTDNVNKVKAGPADFSPNRSFDERMPLTSGRKQSNVVPLEHPRSGFNAMKHVDDMVDDMVDDKDESGSAVDAAYENLEGSTAEIKSRVENVLTRIKSEIAESEIVSPEVSENGNGDIFPSGDEEVPQILEQAATAVSHHAKSVTAELERRRTEPFSQVRSAEAKAIEAEEQCYQARARLEQETTQRKLVEQQLRELEDDYLQRLSAVEAEEARRREAEQACERAEARLKEADARVNEEIEARKQAEKARADAEAKSNSVMLALAGAERKRSESESKVEAARVALAEVEQQKTEAETRARIAEENASAIESLIAEAESIAHTANERFKAAEAKLKHEVESRALAEQKLKALEDELSSYLGLDWSKIEPATAPADPVQVVPNPEGNQNEEAIREFQTRIAQTEEVIKELQTQIEAEQRARLSAEKSRAAAEYKLTEVETELRKPLEKHHQSEAGLKKMLRKQEAELRSFSEQVTRSNSSTTSLSLVKPAEEEYLHNPTAELVMKAKVKMVSYGAIITLLVVAMGWLMIEIYRRM